MQQEETFIVIANGGYIKTPIVERFTIGSDDEEAEEFEDYKEYKHYILGETHNEFAQKFASCIIIPIEEVPDIIKSLAGIV